MATEEATDEKFKTSRYNSAIFQLYRLNNLWVNIHRVVQSKKFESWNTLLDRVWSELSRDLSEKQYTEFSEKYKAIDLALISLGQFKDSTPEGWKEVSEDFLKNRINQYHRLMEKELFLRRLENSLGKGSAFKEDIEDDFE
jgi:hypothetical protein